MESRCSVRAGEISLNEPALDRSTSVCYPAPALDAANTIASGHYSTQLLIGSQLLVHPIAKLANGIRQIDQTGANLSVLTASQSMSTRAVAQRQASPGPIADRARVRLG